MVESQITKKQSNRNRCFHFRYLELCRSKNYPALSDVKAKNNDTTILDFYGDKLKIEDWLLIIDSLYNDTTLHNVAIRLRKTCNTVLENIDTERKARMFKSKPVIFTKFIFTGLVEAISNCIKFNKNLTSLCLEGLPIVERYAVCIVKALSSNNVLQSISFTKSSLGDIGCQAVCNIVKHLPNIELLNFSQCDLTNNGANAVADMIKFQKICRFSEGWMNSLRYRDVDPENIRGLRDIILNHNPSIKDEGLTDIAEVLKDDAWIKVIQMENCGLTDTGATQVLQCLENNRTITTFNVRNNSISECMMKNIAMQSMGDVQLAEDTNGLTRNKTSISKLREKLKFLEEQIANESFRRKNLEALNERLLEQIQNYKKQLTEMEHSQIPDGSVVISKKSLDEIKQERDDLRKTVAAIKHSKVKVISRKHKIRKARSETTAKWSECNIKKCSKSEHGMRQIDGSNIENTKIYFEKDAGDTQAINSNFKAPQSIESSDSADFRGIEALQIFMKKKELVESTLISPPMDGSISAKSLFMGNKLGKCAINR